MNTKKGERIPLWVTLDRVNRQNGEKDEVLLSRTQFIQKFEGYYANANVCFNALVNGESLPTISFIYTYDKNKQDGE